MLTPYYSYQGIQIFCGDNREILPQLHDESVSCVVTSPPYWGLRDYGVIGQIGLEPSIEDYVETLRGVFKEICRILRPDGTVWLNLGDSYAGSWGNQGRKEERGTQRPINGPMMQRFEGYPSKPAWRAGSQENSRNGPWVNRNGLGGVVGLKPKDLCGIPWRVAFALQSDGWYLRSDIIWAKPNPMPESVQDRPTRSHEYIFLLSKSERYYYDAEAIKEPADYPWIPRGGGHKAAGAGHTNLAAAGDVAWESHNKRSVWTVATTPFPEAHFATFPQELIKPCILAGCPPDGIVLDPFAGAGTTLLVAKENNCRAIGIELNESYAEIAARRLSQGVLQFDALKEKQDEEQCMPRLFGA